MQGLALLALGLLVVALVWPNQQSDPASKKPTKTQGPQLVDVDFQGDRTTWQLLALSDEELEKVSLVELNLAVVREIPGYEDLDASKYEAIVDEWAREFAEELPAIDASFKGREAEYHNDLRFYRIGQLMAWLGHKKNIAYIPAQRGLKQVIYKDPGELFLHGLLDTSLGTCGNMPTLQAAIARRLGWPVALAPIESHTVCRFDDGEVAYNIETTHTDKGGFSAGTKEDYAKEFKLPPCAFTEADTLETMSAREMLAYFIALRGRYYLDIDRWELADQDYALARSLLPRQRKLLTTAMELVIRRSDQLYAPYEKRHPLALYRQVSREHEDRQAARRDALHDVERINAENRRRMQADFAYIEGLNAYNRHHLQNPVRFQGSQPNHFDPFQHLTTPKFPRY